jgi:hypothetical protein
MTARPFRWTVLAGATAIALVATAIWYQPDWLGFRKLIAPGVFLVFLGAAWPVLAVGDLLFVRRIGPAILRTATLWVGLAAFGCSSFIIGHSVRTERASRRAGDRYLSDRRIADALLERTHDVTAFGDPPSGVEGEAILSYLLNHPLTTAQETTAVKHYSHSLGVLRALADRADVSAEALQLVFDEAMQLTAASDTASLGARLDSMTTADATDISDLRALVMRIGTNRQAPQALLDEMLRSANPYVREAATKNAPRAADGRP